MRVAILSLMEPVPGEPGELRGYLAIGGRSLARHQLGLALALGCKRIIYLAEALNGELVALQHFAEAGEAQFHVVSTPRALAPLLGTNDEVYVLADGLLAMPEDAMRLLGDGAVVLTLPVESGVAAGYERIDLNYAAAGAMRLQGNIATKLAELPPEWNATSAMLRMAVQAGVAQRAVPSALVDSGRWRLLRSEAEAHHAEPAWLRLHTASAQRRSPGEMVAAWAVRMLGPALLHAGTRPWVLSVAAILLAVLGLGAAWLGSASAGFILLGLGWVLRHCAGLLARIERDSLLTPAKFFRFAPFYAWSLDLLFVIVASWRTEIRALPGVPAGLTLFAPLVLFGLFRLLPQFLEGQAWTHWLEDRLMIGIGLALTSIFLPFDVVLRLTILALIAAGLIMAKRRKTNPNPPLTNEG